MFKSSSRSALKKLGVINGHARDYLASLRVRKFSPKSVDTYRNALESFLLFLESRGVSELAAITLEDLEAYRLELVTRNFAPGSLEVYLRTVRQFFGWLEDNQKLFINPARGLVIPKPPRKLMPVPSEAQMKKLLAQPNAGTKCGVRDRAFLETAYATGARREELAALDIFDVDLDNGSLRVLGKGKKERVLPLGKQAIVWLGKYIQGARTQLLKDKLDEPALWIDLHGKRLEYSCLQQIIRRHCIEAGIDPITPHAIRRACATHMLQHGAHPLQLQMLLGHSTLRTLSQYLRLTITEIAAMHKKSNPGK